MRLGSIEEARPGDVADEAARAILEISGNVAPERGSAATDRRRSPGVPAGLAEGALERVENRRQAFEPVRDG